ncbi:DUF1801 domain-containing protein [Flavobacterium branchiophilum]|uniref:YdhG-like domain-containing protein n=1 Tax=Flavobacterium branchiophilum (strain FL-15) TaxID=1034807 RepID=G2Z146_FLABF|nr:DUF1801 domain-containing protein [Flavobacterium branchiophilum]CCB69609.1 Protein of unknown function [Flavobacterium branchiophilum FL-15]
MTSTEKTPDDYIKSLPTERQEYVAKIRAIILENLPKGFHETMCYGMIGYVVPHEIYPKGYHCDAKQALPFMNVASQKNFISLYHMGLYADVNLTNWLSEAYPKHCKYKLDMGKGCIRFKKMDDIPYLLIAELVKKMTVSEWINQYETAFVKK